jgi:glyoxylate/hydroxypyruvate reductase
MSILLAANLDHDECTRWLALLQAALPAETFVTRRDAACDARIDIAVVANPPAGALQGLPRLSFIQSLWAGVETLLADPTVPDDVPLARMVDPAMNAAMAETALWAVLSLQRGFFECAAQQVERVWQALPQPRADEISVAVLGLGQMGRAVALRLVHGGYRVLGWSAHGAHIPGVLSFSGDSALPAVLAQAQVLVNLLPLTPATRGVLDARAFAQMPAGACVVNLARGAHLVDADLLSALASAHIERAVLDVFHTEPLPRTHAFWSHPRVTLLPHVAAQTDPRSAARVVADNVHRVRRGEPPLALVNRRVGY